MAERYVVTPGPLPVVPVAGGGLFPVRRIWCVARNYAAHAREMGMTEREPPFFFAKPADAVVTDGADAPYPPGTADLQHEVELVAAIGRGGAGIAPEAALAHVFGYAVGLDLTRRDLQARARKNGHPWDMAKGFDHSAPISAIQPAAAVGHPAAGAVVLSVNGIERQRGDLADMIWPVADVIAKLSALVTLAPGDLVFTGTPEGVGPVVPGDVIEAGIAGIAGVRVAISVGNG